MNISKAIVQAVIVFMWTLYVLPRLIMAVRSGLDGSLLATGGVDLLTTVLQSLPLESLLLPTAAMLAAVIGVEAAFLLMHRLERR